jgi:hypothetical protein
MIFHHIFWKHFWKHFAWTMLSNLSNLSNLNNLNNLSDKWMKFSLNWNLFKLTHKFQWNCYQKVVHIIFFLFSIFLFFCFRFSVSCFMFHIFCFLFFFMNICYCHRIVNKNIYIFKRLLRHSKTLLLILINFEATHIHSQARLNMIKHD